MSSLIERLNNDRKSLLQLDGINPLLNFKPLKAKGIEFINTDYANLFVHLLQLKSVEFIGGEQKTLFPLLGPVTVTSPSLRKWKIHCPNYDNKSISNRLAKTFKEAETYIEEKGVNILFIGFCMLKWKESDVSEKFWRSPLILVPVEMRKTKKLDEEGNDIYEICYNEDEVEVNHSLVAALKDRFAIELPSMPNWSNIEPNGEIENEFNKWVSKIQKLILNKKEWELQTNNHALSFFAFTKFFMYKDLDPINWFKPGIDPKLSLFNKVVDEGFEKGEAFYSEDYNLDENLSADKPVTVLDLDSSQAKVILEVQSNKSLVVEGPPGTGKSQTIANLLADAVYNGKRVLFVAEKMVALDVVKRRLESVGLGPSCLELHGAKAKKSEFVKELKSTLLNPVKATLPFPFSIDDLIKNRNELREWSNAVNLKADNGYSPYELIGQLLWVKAKLAQLVLPERKLAAKQYWDEFGIYIDTLTKHSIGNSRQIGDETQTIEILNKFLLDVGPPTENPFINCELQDIPMISMEFEIKAQLRSCNECIQMLIDLMNEFCVAFNIELKPDYKGAQKLISTLNLFLRMPYQGLSEKVELDWEKDGDTIDSMLNHLAKLQDARIALLRKITSDQGLVADIIEARRVLLTVRDNLFNRLFSNELKNSKKIIFGLLKEQKDKSVAFLLSICDEIIDYQKTKSELSKYDRIGNLYFEELWTDEKSNYALLEACRSWYKEYYDLLRADLVVGKMHLVFRNDFPIASVRLFMERLSFAFNSCERTINAVQASLAISKTEIKQLQQIDLSKLILRFQSMIDNYNQLSKWILFNNHCIYLKNTKKGLFVEMALNWPHAPSNITKYFQLLVWEQMLEKAFNERSILKRKSGHSLYETRKKFVESDEQLKNFYRVELINKHAESVSGIGSSGQSGFLRENVQRQRKIPAIRTFLSESFDAIIAIKPIFMMSPLSVASYLEPIPEMFDLVIFDEASQVEPVDSYGAIMRGKQLVVVGDTKQMPPSHFFKKIVNDEEYDDDSTDDLALNVDSIMEIMLAKNAPSKVLQWHYRSKHHSLIAVSNKYFYENRLLIYPSSRMPDNMLGLKIHISDHKSYPYELKGINSNEADMVANAVLEFAEYYPSLSLGVVAFNINQSDLIDKKIKELAIQNNKLSEFINSNRLEPFFVKNLERIQGDERDVIFISIGYGKTAQGVFGHQMGPLNKTGGEKRLNVLITRAKLANHVFCNFSSNEIDLKRTNSFGIKVLKNFLRYAEEGELEADELTGLEPDSDFEIQVAQELRKLNYEVEYQVGSAGYRIDLAVKHPIKKGLFILGIECDGATYHNSKSARDRDRLRQSVLESFGWNIYRIWSTDWFMNKSDSVQKLHTYLQTVIASSNNKDAAKDENNQGQEIIIQSIDTNYQQEFESYRMVDTSKWILCGDVFSILTSKLNQYVMQTVAIEGPIHKEHVCKRIVEFQGISLGSRIRAHLESNIDALLSTKQIAGYRGYLWKKDFKLSNPRNFALYPKKDIDFILSEELQLAVRRVIKNSISINRSELITETARRLGFNATSAVQSKLDSEIKKLLHENSIENIDGFLRIKNI